MCLADFGDYCRARYDMINDYKNRREWTKKSLVNIASAGRFAADTAIRKYADEIWDISPVK